MKTINDAAKYGCINTIKKLYYDAYPYNYWNLAMKFAAIRGHLHEHYENIPCTSAVMDLAAKYGRLNIVKFLHENRSEGCTTRAMDHAASNGHLH